MERASGAAKVLGKVLQNRKQGIGGRRAAVDKALAKLEKPIVVVLDDIDRLSTSEIRDVFKLVRLTASFPNIVYIVAFDRERVEEALSEQGVPGRAYLEKILQVAVDLPVVPFQVLNQQIFTAIDGALAGIETPGRFDEQIWPDAFMEIIRPLIRNMRDVRRYAASIHGTVKSLGGQIALADILSLEAIRVFLPDVFKLLHDTLSALTNVGGNHRESPQMKAQIEALFTAGGPHKEVVQAMIERLFPAAQRHISNTHYVPIGRGVGSVSEESLTRIS
jgi:predicted KAP-like P-loop ATPase